MSGDLPGRSGRTGTRDGNTRNRALLSARYADDLEVFGYALDGGRQRAT